MPCVIHFLPAKAGDCFVIELDNKDCILIDSGFTSTYESELKPLLINLHNKGCRIILLLVTHIDKDHIEGAIRLLTENGAFENPQIIKIENIWFNGFFNTLFTRPQFIKRYADHLNPLMLQRREHSLKYLRMQQPREAGFISAQNSKNFETLCAQNGYPVNKQFADLTVQQTLDTREAVLQSGICLGDCHIYVLGPGKKQLDRLADKLDIELVKLFGRDYQLTKDETFSTFFELLMELHSRQSLANQKISAKGNQLEEWLGTSTLSPMNVINRASIVVEIQYKGIRMLFTGDADSEDWAHLLAPYYHLIKLSHHGTTKPNLILLQKSKGDSLLISTNGGTGGRHPDDELLARAILAGNQNIYFNYDIARKQRLLSLQQDYGFSAQFGVQEITF